MGSGLAAGTQLSPRLRLVRVLGRGSMGEVWAAEDTERGVEVAVKLMATAFEQDPTAARRFEREWDAASKIDSPHVVRMLSQDRTGDGVPYCVMELVDGETLERRLERAGTLSLTEAFRLLVQVGDALKAAHALGIVHRDIKPANIILCPDRAGFRAKVIDFGLAKPWESSSLTEPGIALGTLELMSPEQVLGGKNVDHRADLWALAAVIYYAISGESAFQGDTLHALTFAVCRGHYVPLEQVGVPPHLEPWFEHAFRPDIEMRFGSEREMISEYERHLRAAGAHMPIRGEITATELQLVPPSVDGDATQALIEPLAESAREPEPPPPSDQTAHLSPAERQRFDALAKAALQKEQPVAPPPESWSISTESMPDVRAELASVSVDPTLAVTRGRTVLMVLAILLVVAAAALFIAWRRGLLAPFL